MFSARLNISGDPVSILFTCYADETLNNVPKYVLPELDTGEPNQISLVAKD